MSAASSRAWASSASSAHVSHGSFSASGAVKRCGYQVPSAAAGSTQRTPSLASRPARSSIDSGPEPRPCTSTATRPDSGPTTTGSVRRCGLLVTGPPYASARRAPRTPSSTSSMRLSSALVWLTPPRLRTNSITAGSTRAISEASCSGPLGQRVASAGEAFDHVLGERDQLAVERDRLDREDRLPRHLAALLARRSRGRLAAGGAEHGRQLAGVERPLVERQLAGAVEGRRDAGRPPRTDPVVARTSARRAASSRKATALRAAAMNASRRVVHRRGAGMRVRAG